MLAIESEVRKLLKARTGQKNAASRSKRSQLNGWLSAGREQGWCCHLCGKPILTVRDISMDHIRPQSLKKKGELHGTLKMAHAKCNTARGNMPIRMWKMFNVLVDRFPIVKRSLKEQAELQRLRLLSQRVVNSTSHAVSSTACQNGELKLSG